MITEKEIEQAASQHCPYDESNKHNGPIHWEKHTNKIDKYRSTFKAGASLVLKDMDSEMENFCNWKDDTGWIRRPFPEKSGVYLYDDHGVEDFNFDNGKTHSELLQIYKNRAK